MGKRKCIALFKIAFNYGRHYVKIVSASDTLKIMTVFLGWKAVSCINFLLHLLIL